MTFDEYEKFVGGRAHFERGIDELMVDEEASMPREVCAGYAVSGSTNGRCGSSACLASTVVVAERRLIVHEQT